MQIQKEPGGRDQNSRPGCVSPPPPRPHFLRRLLPKHWPEPAPALAPLVLRPRLPLATRSCHLAAAQSRLAHILSPPDCSWNVDQTVIPCSKPFKDSHRPTKEIHASRHSQSPHSCTLLPLTSHSPATWPFFPVVAGPPHAPFLLPSPALPMATSSSSLPCVQYRGFLSVRGCLPTALPPPEDRGLCSPVPCIPGGNLLGGAAERIHACL